MTGCMRARQYGALRLVLPLLLLLSPLAAARQTDYRIDPAGSQALFHVRLFWLDHINGLFTRVEGEVTPGPRPDSWVVDATIPVDSVNMPSARMRKWVLAPSFFDAAHHPVIHFVSNPFAQSGLDHGGTLTGYLTLRGVTAPVHFAAQPMHCASSVTTSCTITLRGHVHRSDFGMKGDRVALSDDVDLSLSITLQPMIR